MKKFLALLGLPVLMLVMAAPVTAQDSLPCTTNLIVNSRNSTQVVGDLTVGIDGTVTFQIDENATNLRLSDTQLYVGDTPPRGMNSIRFPYRHDRLSGVTSDVYNVDLAAADKNGDGIVYMAAQAGLTARFSINNPRFRRPMFTNFTNETAWAQGDQPSRRNINSTQYFSVPVGWGTAGPPG